MQQFQCKKCDGEIMWDINANALKCPYCDNIINQKSLIL